VQTNARFRGFRNARRTRHPTLTESYGGGVAISVRPRRTAFSRWRSGCANRPWRELNALLGAGSQNCVRNSRPQGMPKFVLNGTGSATLFAGPVNNRKNTGLGLGSILVYRRPFCGTAGAASAPGRKLVCAGEFETWGAQRETSRRADSSGGKLDGPFWNWNETE
jgi:hypothetical protein